MTYEEAVKAYTDKWGGIPYFLMMSMPQEEAARMLEQAVESGKEIEPVRGRVY